jgi:hypothetical protein
MIQRLPESQLTLYAELLDQMIPAAAAAVAEGALAGAFTSKAIKGRSYWYLQRSEGSKVRQIYLGPESPELLGWMERVTYAREVAEPDWTAMRRLGKMLATGGASTEPAAVLKVLKLLADSRVFHLGGVLIGTLAFRSYANSLGVRFQRAALQTQDVDIAQEPAIGVALARESSTVELEKVIASSGLDLHPVPPLDRMQPSTSFKIRGRDLRVDFVTPLKGRETRRAVFLPAFGLSGTPLRHLDYLLAEIHQAVVFGSDVVLVNVPSPARFALHKLWISSRRSAALQTKSRKDRAQAQQLIEVLAEDRPDDLREAWDDLPSDKARGTVRQAMGDFEATLRARFRDIVLTGA